MVAVYIIYKGTFWQLRIEKESDFNSSPIKMKRIDLSIPWKVKHNDKLGYKNLIKSLKYYLFGDESIRLTKTVCEDFFSDDQNFILASNK